jgi:hypothetical protein
MLNDGDVMRSDRLKQVMQGIDPKFDEKDAGFNRFSKFVLSAAGRGLVSLTKMENGQFAIDLGSNANVPLQSETAVKAAGPDTRPKAADARRRRGRKRTDASSGSPTLVLADSFELLKQALMAVGAVGEKSTDRDQAREKMIGLHGTDSDPVFESRRFLRMLRQAHDADHIELIKSDGDQYQLKLSQKAVDEMGDSKIPAAVDESVSDEDAKPARAKKATRSKPASTKRAATKRTTTMRSSRAKTSAAKAREEIREAGPDAETVLAENVEPAVAAGGEVEKKSKAKKATRRKRATSPRSEPKEDSGASADDGLSAPVESASEPQAGAEGEGEESGSPRKKATRRKKTSSKRALKDTKTEEQNSTDVSPEVDPEVIDTRSARPAKRNPRFRRGSRGVTSKPVVQDEEPKPEERSSEVASTPRSTSGARTLGLRRGSRGARTAEPTNKDAEVGDGASPQRVTEEVPADSPGAPVFLEEPVTPPMPKDTADNGTLENGSSEETSEHGLLGRIRAALHKAVGGDAQSSDNESG